MKLSVVATCSGGTCPTIYLQEDGDLVVQGYHTMDTSMQVRVPDGEGLVRIPRSILLEAAARLSAVP